MRALPPFFLLACLNASTKVVDSADTAVDSGGADGSGVDGGGEGGTDGGDGGDGGGDSGEPEEVDEDGDGYSAAEGDCADQDPARHPDQEDACDHVDQDCDGEVDEDAADDEDPVLGTLGTDAPLSVEGSLYGDGDSDSYTVEVTDDGWWIFEVAVELEGIPEGAIYELVITQEGDEERVLYSDYGGDALSGSIVDEAFTEDGGTWRVELRSLGGADCAFSYSLSLQMGVWPLA
jgi:hypothetical protein